MIKRTIMNSVIKLTVSRYFSNIWSFLSVSWKRIFSSASTESFRKAKQSPHFKVGWITAKLNFKPQSKTRIKIKKLSDKESDPETWVGDVWEELTEAEKLKPKNSQSSIASENVFFITSTEDVLTLPPPEILPFSPLSLKEMSSKGIRMYLRAHQ